MVVHSAGGDSQEVCEHCGSKLETEQMVNGPDALLTPSEVAALFRVNPKTVTRWARSGKIHAIRTLGGHRRFHESEITKFLTATEE